MEYINDMHKKLENYAHYIILTSSFSDPLGRKKIIYHYTSSEGLRGILESNEIWLTNTAFANDTTECKSLQNEKDLFVENEITNLFVKKQWESFVRHADKKQDLYVVSFSKDDNSLDQFRTYGNYCIGFDAQVLTKEGFYLHKCVYSKDEIKKWIIEKSNSQRWKYSLDNDHKDAAAFRLIYSASVKYKNYHYKNEEETRIIAVSYPKWDYPNSPKLYENCPPIHFRDHQTLKFPVPYVKLFFEENPNEYSVEYNKLVKEIEQKDTITGYNKFESLVKKWKLEREKNVKRKLLPIKEVIVGPMPHQQEAKTACEILLYEKGYRDLQVKLSEIPYRGF